MPLFAVRKAATASAAVAAVTLAALLATPATAAGGDEDTYVSITVSLDLPSFDSGSGPLVLSVQDKLVGDGPELTLADEISNPSDWCGGLEVDVDMEGRTLTVTGDDQCNFQSAELQVEFSGAFELGGATVIDDGLFGDEAWVASYVYLSVLRAAWNVEGATNGATARLAGTTVIGLSDAKDHPFVDVTGDLAYPGFNEHWQSIGWMGTSGVSAGWSTPAGQQYRPFATTTRDALAAFLFRLYGDTWPTDPPTTAPFLDVSSDPASPHYNEHWEAINWMASNGLALGWPVDGGYEYRPYAPVTRDAVAAFLYRIEFPALPPSSQPFVDVSAFEDDPHYSEHWAAISWMYDTGRSMGWDTANGREFRPAAPITRDAIAAFLFRNAQLSPHVS